MVVHTFNPSTQEAEAGESKVEGEPGLHTKTLSQKNWKNKIRLTPLKLRKHWTSSPKIDKKDIYFQQA
jgi:hypothetical protein